MKIEICETGKKTKKELADGKHKTDEQRLGWTQIRQEDSLSN